MSLADVVDFFHHGQHFRILILARHAQLLGQVALSDEDDTDAGDLLKDVRQVLDAQGALDHHGAEHLSLGIQPPEVCTLVVLLVGNTPVVGSTTGCIATSTEGLKDRVFRTPGVSHGSHGVVCLFYGINMGPDDAVHAGVQHLLGDPVGLARVRWDAHDGRHRRGDGTAAGDLLPVQHGAQPVVELRDVVHAVFHLE